MSRVCVRELCFWDIRLDSYVVDCEIHIELWAERMETLLIQHDQFLLLFFKLLYQFRIQDPKSWTDAQLFHEHARPFAGKLDLPQACRRVEQDREFLL